MVQRFSTQRQALEACLATLTNDSMCEAALLLDEIGELVAAQGTHDVREATLLGKLVASTFASSRTMARLMGGHDDLQMLFQQGERANTLFMLIQQHWILAIIARASQPLGAIKINVRHAVTALEQLLNTIQADDAPKILAAPRPTEAREQIGPRARSYAQRLARLRGQLIANAPATGTAALKLLEHYIESLARLAGAAPNVRGMSPAIAALRDANALNPKILTQLDVYAQTYQCLTHAYGVQATPTLAEEVIGFMSTLLRLETSSAARMMSRNLRTVLDSSSLAVARDVMLREGLGQLPVLRSERTLLGLLTERDIVLAEARQPHGSPMRVGDALPSNSKERVGIVGADASYETVVDALRRPGVQALIVTPTGGSESHPLGIITHADLLYRL